MNDESACNGSPSNQVNEPDGNGDPMSLRKPYKLCGAKKKNGQACRGAVMPNGRCRLHGGATPAGIASPHYKHGKYSKHNLANLVKRVLPEKLAVYCEALENDEVDLLDLHGALLVQEAMKADLFRQWKETEAPPWKEAAKLFGELKRVYKTGDAKKTRTAMAALEETMRGGRDAAKNEQKLREQILDLDDRKVRLVMAQHKRDCDLHVLVEVRYALGLVEMVINLAKEEWGGKDPKGFSRYNQRILKALPLAEVVDSLPAAGEPLPNGDQAKEGTDG